MDAGRPLGGIPRAGPGARGRPAPVTVAPRAARLVQCRSIMRRTPLLLASALTLAACAPRRRPPEPATGPAASAGYTCAYRHLRSLGYTVTRAAPESGVVAGERAAGGALTEWAGWDELVVRAPIGVRGRGTVRVTARGGVLEGGRRRAAAASTRAAAHAAAITSACGDTRPSGGG